MRSIAILVSLLLLPALTHGGVIMTTQVKHFPANAAGSAAQGDDVSTQTMQADNNQLRMDMTRKGGIESTMVFKNNAMYIVDNKTKTYHVMDEATMNQMGDKMAAMRKQMEARMASMPPAQRAMMEKMMGKSGMRAPMQPEHAVYARTSRSETVAGIKCQVWEGKTKGEKSDEVCIAPKGSVAGINELFVAMKGFAKSMQKMTERMGVTQNAMESGWRDLEKFDGFPIEHRDFEGGKLREESQLTSIRSASVPASTFEMPAGYKLKTMSMGREE